MARPDDPLYTRENPFGPNDDEAELEKLVRELLTRVEALERDLGDLKDEIRGDA